MSENAGVVYVTAFSVHGGFWSDGVYTHQTKTSQQTCPMKTVRGPFSSDMSGRVYKAL